MLLVVKYLNGMGNSLLISASLLTLFCIERCLCQFGIYRNSVSKSFKNPRLTLFAITNYLNKKEVLKINVKKKKSFPECESGKLKELAEYSATHRSAFLLCV